MIPAIETIDRYEIIRLLGQGGMGAVYLARDPQLGRDVAIKLLPESFSMDQRRRFLHEARATSQLRHPNIVVIHDSGEHRGRPFIVMEYIPGRTLKDLIARAETVSVIRKLEIIEEICEGLAHAHGAGIIHRDVKPANVMVDETGLVKIVDFGIARSTASASLKLTRTFEVPGTLCYMSPEQVSRVDIDPRSDMFSAGVVAYELLTGRRPFPLSGDIRQIAAAILTRDPPPMSAPGRPVPPVVEQAVVKALAKNPVERYQDMAAMQSAVAAARLHLSRPPPQPPSLVDTDAATLAGDRARLPPARDLFGAVTGPPQVSLDGRRLSRDILSGDPEARADDQVAHARRVWLVRAVLGAGAIFVVALVGWLSFTKDRPVLMQTLPSGLVQPDAPASGRRPMPAKPTAASKRNPANPETRAAAVVTAASPISGTEPSSTQASSAADRPDLRESKVPEPEASLDRNPVRGLSAPPGDAVPPPAAPSPLASVPSSPDAAPPVTLSSAGEEAIRIALRAFESAFDNLSGAALKASWPSLTIEDIRKWDRDFAESASYHVEINTPQLSLVSPSRARVDCSIVRAYVPKQGEPRRRVGKATVVLDRTESGWVISRITGPGWQ